MARPVMLGALTAAGLLILVNAAVFAHHSASMYDKTKPRTLTGTVKQVRWVNPHAVIVLTVGAAGKEPAADWAVELGSPGNMAHLGWSHSTLRAGEPVEIAINPMRDGSHNGGCRTVKLLDMGKTMDCGLGDSILAAEKPNLR
jgi:hypothetical protein